MELHTNALVIVDDLHVMSVPRIEAKDKSPGTVDGDGPRTGSITGQPMQPDASQPPEIVERLRGV